MAAGAGVALASFLPWAKVTAPFVGTITKSGIDDGGDGIFSLILGVLIAVAGWRVSAAGTKAGRMATVVLVLSVLAAALAVFEWQDISSGIDELEGEAGAEELLVDASVGSGIYLMAASALVGIGAWIWQRRSPSPGA